MNNKSVFKVNVVYADSSNAHVFVVALNDTAARNAAITHDRKSWKDADVLQRDIPAIAYCEVTRVCKVDVIA